jgi:polyhydroxyalkanoate synthesis regulator phasin
MNSGHLLQLMQKGLRVTLGATTSLVETIQDPQKREQNLSQLRSELSEKVQEWEEKGEVTEQSARTFVDSFVKQRNNPTNPTETAENPYQSVTPPNSPTPPDVQQDIQELTDQLAALRSELEKLRETE